MKQHLTMRLPTELLGRIDAFSTALANKTGLDIKRADVIRLLLTAGLEQKEKDLAK
ncbi:hypothetical protein PLA106_13682 [Pseudomonas amygdali pv. lachrymans str. M302278]|nr:hypothetical protein PLA106_13682 [Pseudomonas amygdali pv. lachrymans str. M302278]